MSHQWPAETVFRRIDLYIRDQVCVFCGGNLQVCSHRRRRVFTLQKGRGSWSCGWAIAPSATALAIVARSAPARRWPSPRHG